MSTTRQFTGSLVIFMSKTPDSRESNWMDTRGIGLGFQVKCQVEFNSSQQLWKYIWSERRALGYHPLDFPSNFHWITTFWAQHFIMTFTKLALFCCECSVITPPRCIWCNSIHQIHLFNNCTTLTDCFDENLKWLWRNADISIFSIL